MNSSGAASSSLSDYQRYVDACNRAVQSEDAFRTFKQDPDYKEILEHTTPELGASYVMSFIYQTPQLLSKIETFKRNDLIGGATVHDYGEHIGAISPSTLRYMKVLSDLTVTFGSLDGMHIVEIGGGYGGQCLITSLCYRCASYTIIDLPCALALQRKYVAAHNLTDIRFLTMEDLPSALSSDLVVSNYAITECRKEIVDRYCTKVVSHARRGYITGNYLSEACYTRAEMEAKIPRSVAVGEFPPTYQGNYLLLWK